MSYPDFLFSTPYSWVGLAAVLFGCVVADLTRLSARRKKGRWAVSRLWTRIYLLLTFLVMCAPALVFLADRTRLFDPALLPFAGVLVATAFAAARFPRAVGVPLLLLSIAGFSLLSAALRPWTPVSEPGQLFSIRVLSVSSEGQRLELLIDEEGVDVVELPGNAFGVRMERLSLRPELFLLGFEVAYRPVAIDAYRYDPEATGAVFRSTGEAYSFPSTENFFRRSLRAGTFLGMRLHTAFSGTTEAHALNLHRLIIAPHSVELRLAVRDAQTSFSFERAVSLRGE